MKGRPLSTHATAGGCAPITMQRNLSDV